ncbi:transcription initiation factor TFIID subunit TAF5 [Nucleospora cyclopteri]
MVQGNIYNKETPKLRIDIPKPAHFNDPSMNRVELFDKLKTWVEDSLDLFKNDLIPLLYPIFLHIYVDLISMDRVDEAKEFFAKYKGEFSNNEIKAFDSIYSQQHIYQNAIVNGFRTNKYFLVMSKYAYNLLINFIEENDMLYILKLMNSYMEIKVQTAANISFDASRGNQQGVGTYVDQKPIDLSTSLMSVETESSILSSDEYKYDHLETYVQQLKKQRKSENKVKPSPSLVEAEIEKLKDICKRVSLNKDYLPSICCYTVQNTYESLTCAEISNDSKFLACGYSDSYIDVHSLTKEPLRRLKKSSELAKMNLDGEEDKFEDVNEVFRLVGHSGPVFSVKFSNTSKMLISASADCTVRLWNLQLMECIAVFKNHVFPVWTVDFAPNDFYFASGGADKQLVVYCTKSTRPERLILSSLSDVTVVKFHPNSNYVFSGSCDYKVRMHELETAQVVRTFSGHTDSITCIDISHDGKLMATGSKDKKIILWDIDKAIAISTYTGHEGFIYSLSFCYFGSILCSSGSDNSVRLWDKTDSKSSTAIASYFTKNTPIISVKFSYRNIVSCVGPFIG